MNVICNLLLRLGDVFMDLAQLCWRNADKTGCIEWKEWEPEE